MIKENRVSKYLLYAIGEIILVVIGILIALQINNWNEARKEGEQRQQLISSLLEDFEYNRETLLNHKLPAMDMAMEKMELFFRLMQEDTDLNKGQLLSSAQVSVDSLRKLAIPFFQSEPFSANLTTLSEASSSGKLSLLKNKELFREFTQFEMYYDRFLYLTEESTHAYFNGCLWEIRRTVDPDVLAGRKSMPNLNYEEYKKIMDQPLAKTALYNAQILRYNKRSTLSNLLENTDKIISILKEMQES